MIYYAIDGATRRPGKPDCIALGAVIKKGEDFLHPMSYLETESTSQRGEILALIQVLEDAVTCEHDDIYIITDSEYLFNTISKDWAFSWARKGWVNAEGAPIKNQDLWKSIVDLLDDLDGAIISIYHTKGHLISVGKVTAAKCIEASGIDGLYKLVKEKYPIAKAKYADKHAYAKELFISNHGFEAPQDVYEEMIIMNNLVDIYAGYMIDQLDKN